MAEQIRPRITPEEYEIIKSQRLGVNVNSKTTPNDYKEKASFVLSAWNDEGRMMEIDEYCQHYNLPRQDISSYKLVSHTGTPFYNIVFKEKIDEKLEKELDFTALFSHIQPVKVEPKSLKIGLFDRVVYTDVHIAMDTNKNGHSLYGGKWDEDELEERLELFVNKILKEQDSNVLYLDELGDFMDGWDGYTTRGGHSLPQNMDNQKAYDVALSFKIRLIDELVKHYDKIVCHNICNDNHAGAFGYVVNSAFKTVMQYKYPKNVEVINQRKFINHYQVGNYVFILTHGKDDKALKFGFKPLLDPKQIEKISDYIDEHYLNFKGAVIEFSKGDSHQWLFDNSTSDKFNYYNYPAFSPSSEWVQTNFCKGKSGFICFNYYKDSHKRTNEYLFEWKRAEVA